jgi:hypothetical protein
MPHKMGEALAFLQKAPTVPHVAIVGHMSRTRYVDQDMLAVVLEILRDARLFRPVHGGKPPFDMYVEEACLRLGLLDVMAGHEDRSRRYEPRPLSMLNGCCMLVAFPPEGEKLENADPAIVDYARRLGLPILGVSRQGETTWT